MRFTLHGISTPDEGQKVYFYLKIPKFLDAGYLCCKRSKIQTRRFYHGVIPLNDANGIANSADPDQTSPLHCIPRPICPKTKGHYGKSVVAQLTC